MKRSIFIEYNRVRPDIFKETSGGDLDEKIDFHRLNHVRSNIVNETSGGRS